MRRLRRTNVLPEGPLGKSGALPEYAERCSPARTGAASSVWIASNISNAQPAIAGHALPSSLLGVTCADPPGDLARITDSALIRVHVS